jgi:hypothetical protein
MTVLTATVILFGYPCPVPKKFRVETACLVQLVPGYAPANTFFQCDDTILGCYLPKKTSWRDENVVLFKDPSCHFDLFHAIDLDKPGFDEENIPADVAFSKDKVALFKYYFL